MSALLEQVENLQNILIAHATGDSAEDPTYISLRQKVISRSELEKVIPEFVRDCRNLHQFWQFIKSYPTYALRREFIWESFRPMFNKLEQNELTPLNGVVSASFKNLDGSSLALEWKKALERVSQDPQGSITMARTLLESTCKYILDDAQVCFEDSWDLPKLYGETARLLNLSPSQHVEKIFKQILGSCQAVVEGLGSLRSRLGDAHGKGKNPVRPSARHAELAVNLSGSLSTYLLATWAEREQGCTPITLSE